MPQEPDRDEGNEHTTGAGHTPPRRILRSAGAEDTPGSTLPGPTDHVGSGADAAAHAEGPAITGLHETGAAEAPDPRTRRQPGGG